MASGTVQGQAPRRNISFPAPGKSSACPAPFAANSSRRAPQPLNLTLQPLPSIPAAVTRPLLAARLGLPPTRPLMGPTTLPVLHQSLAQTQLQPLANVAGDLFANPTPFVAPGVFIPGIGGAGRLGPYVDVRYYATLFIDAQKHPWGENISVGFLNASAMGAFEIFVHGTTANGIFALLGNGFLNLGTSYYMAAPGQLQVLSFNITAWRDYLGVGGQYVYADTAAHLLAIAAVGVGKIARRDVINMGPYRGPDAHRLAEFHGLPAGTPMRKLQLSHRTGETLSVRCGGGMFLLAGLARFDLLRTRERAYRTFVGPERARELLLEGGGWRKFFRDKGRALGWVKEPMQPPNMAQPDTLPVGDELGFTTSRSVVLGALLGNLGGWLGYNVTRRNDLELAVRRFGPHHVEVILTPVKVRAPQLYAVSPFGPNFSSRQAHAQAVRYGMVFDLRDANAMQAYQATLDGHPPGLDIHDVQPHLQDAAITLPQTLHSEQANLPSGVNYTFLQLFNAEARDFGGGLKWLFIPRELLPRGWESALTYHGEHGHEEQAVTDGDTVITSTAKSQNYTAELVWNGVRSCQVGATQRWETFADGAREFLGLSLQAQLGETHVSRGGFAEHFIKPLNRHFGTQITLPLRPHQREDRQTQISRTLDDAAVMELASILAPEGGGSTDTAVLRVMNAARQAGANYHALYRLLRGLAAEPGVEARNTAIQTYVQKRGLRGFAAIHRLLGGDPAALIIRSASSVYDEALGKADLLTLRYPTPAHDSDPAADLAQRWHTLAGGLTALQTALEDVADDGLLTPEARQGHRGMLAGLRAKLHAAMPSSPAQVEAMRAWCAARFWQRGWHKQLLLATEDPSELLQESWATVQQHTALPTDVAGWCARWEDVNRQANALRVRLVALHSVQALIPPAAYAQQHSQLTAALAALVGPECSLPRRGLIDLRILDAAQRSWLAAQLRAAGTHADLQAALRSAY